MGEELNFEDFNILFFTFFFFAKSQLWRVNPINGGLADGWMDGWLGEGRDEDIYVWWSISNQYDYH